MQWLTSALTSERWINPVNQCNTALVHWFTGDHHQYCSGERACGDAARGAYGISGDARLSSSCGALPWAPWVFSAQVLLGGGRSIISPGGVGVPAGAPRGARQRNPFRPHGWFFPCGCGWVSWGRSPGGQCFVMGCLPWRRFSQQFVAVLFAHYGKAIA